MEYTRSHGGLLSVTNYPYTDYFGQETNECLLNNDDDSDQIPLSDKKNSIFPFSLGGGTDIMAKE